ncbi:hypothetical protein [uncultured Paracoccus sp.]|uniref:hypothetical protein n=1 Tax=uncultured Paracoccus sp. TaxID=189685 RepID=UPI00261AC3B9|nr:hypothetical protein [uncultured Paracoccus sp.]
MLFRAATCLFLLGAPIMAAETEPPFIDDRSSAERVVTSLYNAINRHEYLRGWSYFAEGGAPPYPEFRDGYADTDSVELKLGEVQAEGAAGSVHFLLPVALKATGTDGTEKVFTGCYRLTQVQPAVQDTPPYRPIQIDSGELAARDIPFTEAMGSCTP